VWLTKRLPYILIREPERIALIAAYVVIGSSVLLGLSPVSLSNRLPRWIVLEWGLTLGLGGAATLFGMMLSTRGTLHDDTEMILRGRIFERVGTGATCTGSMIYGLALLRLGWSGAAPGAIFVALSLAGTIRLLVSTSGKAILTGGINT
jgi:hypothetical protein